MGVKWRQKKRKPNKMLPYVRWMKGKVFCLKLDERRPAACVCSSPFIFLLLSAWSPPPPLPNNTKTPAQRCFLTVPWLASLPSTRCRCWHQLWVAIFCHASAFLPATRPPSARKLFAVDALPALPLPLSALKLFQQHLQSSSVEPCKRASARAHCCTRLRQVRYNYLLVFWPNYKITN